MTLATLVAFAAEEAEHHDTAAIMLETFPYGVVALVAFTLLAFVTLSYRNVANRHAHKGEAYAKAHANDIQQAGHGH
ncbi:hypothetical protein [Microbacterium sp. RU33B]|uniref:hypothetical protein n=1 Tax=Microbacterium sp. RU33B TaxID=1907390 RepID=UPI0009598946|nr:hypothetical protein [Microbacterium sp. RU33B]SIT73872.1 hypothetical protein SAMN05880545_1279 [Microbacterium sp. RU33B]